MSGLGRKVWENSFRVFSRFFAEGHLTHAAALAFYGLFSVPALLIVALRVAALAFDEKRAQTMVLDTIGNWMGPKTVALVASSLEHISKSDDAGGTLILGVAVLLISGSSVFSTMQSILNGIFGAKQSQSTQHVLWTFIKRRLFSMGLVLILGLMLLLTLGLETVVAALSGWMAQSVPASSAQLPWISTQLVMLLPMAAIFTLIYKILPDAPLPWKHCALGAMVTTALFVICKLPIRLYLSHTHPGNAYHAAGGILMMMMWMFLVSAVFLLGAVISHEMIQVLAGPSHHPDSERQNPEPNIEAKLETSL